MGNLYQRAQSEGAVPRGYNPAGFVMDKPRREIKLEMDRILANATGEIDPVVVHLSNQVQYAWELVEGRKRLEAYHRLGYTTVPVRVLGGTEADAGMWLLGQDLQATVRRTMLQRSWWAMRLLEQGG